MVIGDWNLCGGIYGRLEDCIDNDLHHFEQVEVDDCTPCEGLCAEGVWGVDEFQVAESS